MRTGAFILFFSIVLVVYTLVNYYIFIRGLQAIPSGNPWRIWYSIAFWVIASTFVLARIMERVHPCLFTGIITWIGSFWLAFMLYFFLIVLVIDILRLGNLLFHWFPAVLLADVAKTRLVIFFASIIVVTLAVAAGFINARIPKTRELEIRIDKKVEGMNELNVVMVSDIHLGTLIARHKADNLVRKINALHPDLVLLVGDIVDEDLAPVIKDNLGANLQQLKGKFGVYGITGNHEYIGGVERAVQYISEHGVIMLRDTAILVDGKFWLAGREDRDRPRFTGKVRKELSDIMKDVDRSKPVILMDHQPFFLENAAEQGVDLQVSGHTHHGQLWPFNLVTNAMYEVSRGYKKKGNTHFYVSTGFGSWGPPVRIGNRPEIVRIKMMFR
jgi:predicted MPP superfamily phosphohydrolase